MPLIQMRGPRILPRSVPSFCARSRAILVNLDLRDGGDAEMQIEFAVKLLEMTWPSIGPGRTVLPERSTTVASGGIGISLPWPILGASTVDDDHGVFDGRTAGAINQRAAF